METNFESDEIKKIKLYGTIGEFDVEHSVYKLKYFNTIANNRVEGSSYNELLEKLSPMREKTKATEIRDLRSLLQRDLNDQRVSRKLIPYLLNSREIQDHIAFFPSILCVMMPKGFILNDSPIYPDINEERTTDVGNKIFCYDDFWEYEQYVGKDKKNIPLASLTIFTAKTEMVVIDGQHRANAFRVVTNNFDPNGSNHIYSHFYKDTMPAIFKADLPVTILWFESTDNKKYPVLPDTVSRKLFLDVNNSPEPVSISRQILMDDITPSRVVTQFFYSYLSNRDPNKSAFIESEFSLFHSGFDFDQDIKSKNKPSVFTITVPEIFNHAMDWILFGHTKYNSLSQLIAKAERKELSNFDEYINLDPDNYVKYIEFRTDADDNKIKCLKPCVVDVSFEEKIRSSFLVYIYRLYNEMNFLKPHFEACEILGSMAKNQENEFKSAIWKECWDTIIKGGEGLYYVFKNKPDTNIENYVKDLDKIEDLFQEKRAEIFVNSKPDKIKKSFATFLTLAFQVGYIKAFDHFHRNSNSPFEIDKSIESFMKRINKFSADEWVYILTEIKNLYETKSLSPTKWPSFQNLIIRLIQKKGEFYDKEDNFKDSPDYYMIESEFSRICTAKAESENTELSLMNFSDFEATFIDKTINDSINNISEKLNKINLTILDYPIDKLLKSSLKKSCKK